MTVRAQQPARDPQREGTFLRVAARTTCSREFVAHCTTRLEQGERKFGDRWRQIGLDAFVRELAEEAADVGAWAALAEQAAELEGRLDAGVHVRLHLIARAGALAHEAVESLADLLGAGDSPRKAAWDG